MGWSDIARAMEPPSGPSREDRLRGASDRARGVNREWANWTGEQARWDRSWFPGRELLQAFGVMQAPSRPETALPPDLNNPDALLGWFEQAQRGQSFRDSALGTIGGGTYDRQTAIGALADTLFQDIATARDLQAANREDRLRLAGEFARGRDAAAGRMTRDTQAAFGAGGPSGRMTEIDKAVGAGLDRVNQAYGVAKNVYQTVLQQYRRINQQMETLAAKGMQTFDKQAADTLRQLYSTAAAQAETVRTSVRTAVAAETSEMVAAHRQMGYGLDSPQVQKATLEIAARGREHIGGLLAQGQAEFNRLATETRRGLAQTRGELAQMWGQTIGAVATETLGTVERAGATWTGTATDGARIAADLLLNGQREKTATIEVWNRSQNAIEYLRFMGDVEARNALAAATNREFIAESPLVQMLMNTIEGYRQQDFTNTITMMNLALNALQVFHGLTSDGGSGGGSGGSGEDSGGSGFGAGVGVDLGFAQIGGSYGG